MESRTGEIRGREKKKQHDEEESEKEFEPTNQEKGEKDERRNGNEGVRKGRSRRKRKIGKKTKNKNKGENGRKKDKEGKERKPATESKSWWSQKSTWQERRKSDFDFELSRKRATKVKLLVVFSDLDLWSTSDLLITSGFVKIENKQQDTERIRWMGGEWVLGICLSFGGCVISNFGINLQVRRFAFSFFVACPFFLTVSSFRNLVTFVFMLEVLKKRKRHMSLIGFVFLIAFSLVMSSTFLIFFLARFGLRVWSASF